MRLRIAAV